MSQTALQVYVQKLYQNVLQRDGDTGGISHWTSQASKTLNSIDMVHGFIASVEAQGVITVLRLYDIFFDRAADSSGLRFWVETMRSGASLRDIAVSFAQSSEFHLKYSQAATADFVEALYANLFERPSDASGKAFWCEQIESGRLSIAEVALEFTVSTEARSADGAATRFAESYLLLRSTGKAEPSAAAVEALAQKSLVDAIIEVQTVKGTVQNGLIQYATVSRDADGDGLPDASGNTVTTDANGNFSIVGGYGEIVVTGGKDLTTGKANDKILSTTTGGDYAHVMVTPLTTVVNAMVARGMNVADAMKKVSLALGLPEKIDLLSFNHTATALASDSSQSDQKNAVAVKGTIAQLTILIENTAGLIKGVAGSAISLDAAAITSSVAKALAARIISATEFVSAPNASALISLDSQGVIKELASAAAAIASAAGTTPLNAAVLGNIAALSGDAAKVIGELNAMVKATVNAINSSSSIGTAKVIDALSLIAKTEGLGQDKVQAALTTGAQTGSMSNALALYTGINLANSIKAEQIGEIAKGVNGTSGGTVIDQVIAPSPSQPEEALPPSSFSVTESTPGSKVWTLSAGNGNVVVTDDGTNFVFTPSAGTARAVEKSGLNEVVVSGITLSGLASVLTGISRITGAVTVSDAGLLAAADLKSIEAATTALVNATSVAAVSGSVADAKLLLLANEGSSGDKIDMRHDVAVALSGTTTISAADLVALDAKTTGNISAVHAATLNGTTTNVTAVLSAKGSGANQYDFKDDVPVVLSDTAVFAYNLLSLRGKTSGNISAVNATRISGELAELTSVAVAEGIGAGQYDLNSDVAVTLYDEETVSAADLIAVGSKTTGNVYSPDAPMISGTVSDALIVMSAKGTGPDQYRFRHPLLALDLSGDISAANINSLRNALGSGNIRFNGTAAADILDFTGVTGRLSIHAGADNDVITGGSAGDIIYGDVGNDTIFGGSGADTLVGGAGADVYAYEGNEIISNGVDQLSDFNPGADKVRISLTGSNINGSAFTAANGTGTNFNWAEKKAGNIFIDAWTSYSMNQVYVFTKDSTGGTNEAIQINIKKFVDVDNLEPIAPLFEFNLTGTDIADILTGGAGADMITGGKGADSMTGGHGGDTFVFTAAAGARSSGTTFGEADVITDFAANADMLRFSGVADVESAQQSDVQMAVTNLGSDATEAAIATAMATANTTNFGVSFAVYGGNTFVLFETAGSGEGVAADDVFIKLTGIATLPTFASAVIA